MNLRAALLRQLTDLKKDGVLGGNVILRKTMLDECKGDKFEELLAIFSLMVLKKVLAKSNNQHNTSSVKSNNLVPLILSHRKVIQRDLEKRKELDLRTRQQQRNIDASIKALTEEAIAWKNRKAPAIPKNADTLKRLVRENWIGDSDWVETILYGAPPTPVLTHDEPHQDEEDDASLPLTDLDSRVRAHNARLGRWQDYLNTLRQNRSIQPAPTQSKAGQSTSSTRFERHQDITLNADSSKASLPDIELKSSYIALLETLDKNMSKPVQPLPVPDSRVQARPKISTFASRSFNRSTPTSIRLTDDPPARKTSDASSQDTMVGEPTTGDRARPTGAARWQPDGDQSTLQTSNTLAASVGASITSSHLDDQLSLAERTRKSLAQFETPRAKLHRSKTSISPSRDEPGPAIATRISNTQSDRTSLAERTRQSMSLLANALDDHYQPRNNAKPNRPRHTKSKSMYLSSTKPRLERAWSEESLASAAKDDAFDVEADYESVFKSRPRLAMSPNLSPSRSNDQLDADLEDALNKLTINSSSPGY